MEVGIISPINVFPPTFGGSVRIYQISKNLGELGCSVHLFIPEGGRLSELKNVKVYECRELNHIKKHYPISLQGIYVHSASLVRLIKKLSHYQGIDIVQSQHLLTALHGLTLKGLLRKPAILSEHNVETLVWHQINYVKKQRWKKLLLLEKFACKRFDHVVSQTPFDKHMIETLCSVEPSKVTVIPNGVDTQCFSSKKDERERIRSKYGLREQPVVLFTGRLNWFANADALKILFSEIYPTLKERIPNAVFMVVGTNPPSWLTNYPEKDVILTHAPHHEVSSYINAADVCIAPLRFGSGMCLKTLEYMSCEKPVVSTSCGARGLHVTNRKNIIIENDFKLFAKKIAQLLEDNSLAEKIGKEARRLIEGTYDWKIIANEFVKIYRRLLT